MLVSVITPCHNAATTLVKSVEASLAQDLPDLEVICIDDGSLDATWSLLEQLAGCDNRLKIIRRKECEGVSSARNLGVAHARGKWVCFVDADDAPAPGFCSRLYHLCNETGADIGKGSYNYENGIRKSGEINAQIRTDKNRFCIQFASALYRRSLLADIRFNESLSYSEDNLFALSAALKANKIVVDDDACLHIGLLQGSTTLGPVSQTAVASHFNSLDAALDLLSSSGISGASFNYNLATLSGLVMEITGRSRIYRKLAERRAQEFFKSLERNQLFDRKAFSRQAPKNMAIELDNLLEGRFENFFRKLDLDAIKLCRSLQRKKGESVH